jgi:putative acetyltransferase
MVPDDYDAAYALWSKTQGMGLSAADSQEGIGRFLKRNSDLSLVAEDRKEIVGTVLCGHDGRRGYLHHLAVARSHRGQGLGKRLVQICLENLKAIGIQKCHVFLHRSNNDGKQFWRRLGWQERAELEIMSKDIEASVHPA